MWPRTLRVAEREPDQRVAEEPEELEEIVTDVGQSPWLWGHAVSFDLERRSHRILYKTRHLEIALFGWAAGPGHRVPRPRRGQRRGIRLQRDADRGHRGGGRRARPQPACSHPARRVGLQLRPGLHPPGAARPVARRRDLDPGAYTPAVSDARPTTRSCPTARFAPSTPRPNSCRSRESGSSRPLPAARSGGGVGERVAVDR